MEAELTGLLRSPTPEAWFEQAPRELDVLLLDHANCEKKAASTALALLFAYPDGGRDNLALSRVAREELRHYEQVQHQLARLGISFRRLAPCRYAEGLRKALPAQEPARRLGLLLVSALIEARSCERFAGLVPRLEPTLGAFYGSLHDAESRHRSLYLELARRHAEAQGLDLPASLDQLACLEAELATAPDPVFRFHSGRPG
ncbi:MAG: tRNA isopentenyl-2-thiomethyl-A-37 hydroxylase MiaE [Steroidobacteraceae bacterium]